MNIESNHLLQEFFAQPALSVARQLLGMRLVRVDQGIRLAGIITEVEAYRGEEDQGCHAKAGRTPRTEVMYGPPGHAYVYFTYGMHWCLNFVVEREGFPAAVLLRSIDPTEGLEVIATRRSKQPKKLWANGPGKICQALSIDRRLNGANLCAEQAELFVELGETIPDESVTIGPRVGLNSVPEPWKSIPWRFLVKRAQAPA